MEGLLLEGHSINLVGLSGSGRTQALNSVARSLSNDDGFWSIVVWTAAALQSLDRREKADALALLLSSPGVPVLLIDDYGEFLVTSDGKWLEQVLFAATNQEPQEGVEYLRCVVVTHPRDCEIQVSGSGLRERSKLLHPPRGRIAPETRGRFGEDSDAGILSFCGGTHLLVPPSKLPAASERGVAIQRARERAPDWVGQLGGDHQLRLASRMTRPSEKSRWRDGGVDEFLVPMAVAVVDGDSTFCHVVDALDSASYVPLLLSERWPSRDLVQSARRFVARAGNEPSPLWIDNFLSDVVNLRFDHLVSFIRRVLSLWNDGRSLRILSRSYVGNPVAPAEVLSALVSAGLKPAEMTRLEWRLYDQRDGENLHSRQLILQGRGVAFSLPPASVLIGDYAVGNESDGEILVRDHSAVRAAWQSATRVC